MEPGFTAPRQWFCRLPGLPLLQAGKWVSPRLEEESRIPHYVALSKGDGKL